MMGSGGRGVSICPATWKHCCRPVPDTQRDQLAHRPHGNDAASALVRRKRELLWSCGGRGSRRLLAPTELAAVSPHAMQNHRQLAGYRDASARHAPTFGDVTGRPLQNSDLVSVANPSGAADQPLLE